MRSAAALLLVVSAWAVQQLAGVRDPRAGDDHEDSVDMDETALEPGEGAAAGPVAATGESGLLSLNSVPWGRVWIDGKDTGKATPVFNHQLPAGPHRITIHFSTGGFMTEEVEIRAGETTRKIVRESR
jgi:serine/threonine-protein kinase